MNKRTLSGQYLLSWNELKLLVCNTFLRTYIMKVMRTRSLKRKGVVFLSKHYNLVDQFGTSVSQEIESRLVFSTRQYEPSLKSMPLFSCSEGDVSYSATLHKHFSHFLHALLQLSHRQCTCCYHAQLNVFHCLFLWETLTFTVKFPLPRAQHFSGTQVQQKQPCGLIVFCLLL